MVHDHALNVAEALLALLLEDRRAVLASVGLYDRVGVQEAVPRQLLRQLSPWPRIRTEATGEIVREQSPKAYVGRPVVLFPVPIMPTK